MSTAYTLRDRHGAEYGSLPSEAEALAEREALGALGTEVHVVPVAVCSICRQENAGLASMPDGASVCGRASCLFVWARTGQEGAQC